MFTATIHQPGCLPDATEPPPQFPTARKAWRYLIDERMTDVTADVAVLMAVQKHGDPAMAAMQDYLIENLPGTVITHDPVWPNRTWHFSVDETPAETYCDYVVGQLPTGDAIACGKLTQGSSRCAEHRVATAADAMMEVLS